MSDPRQLYQQVLLEHHRAPRNSGALERWSHRFELHNPLCGDRTLVTLQLRGDAVEQVRCETRGCAICRASGSMMTEAVAGKARAEALALSSGFRSLVLEPEAGEVAIREPRAPLGPLAVFADVKRYPGRSRCATLPWEALERALGSTS